ncbi:putative LPS assembly protein LptD [Mucilaginibacter psychrotolerans]|uniref:LPS-assembly protein LptD n=1 Tax=Mucilaginibacter psychrotolerans TaxID=1524096 RepID=A0A4Y8SKY1_9SPHI|nr:putative LPS assembly protein LptD [Mucilaginibacter psychrotolerans]TFF39598.1 LPS-assembly protein LptD [Mucilaginibacter psychrotolerans]
MKLVAPFFLFALMVIVSFAAKASNAYGKTLAKDTIIKLDSVRDRKLLKLKKPAANAKNNNAVAQRDTTVKGSGLKSIIKATAEDSSYTDRKNKLSYLWGRAKVVYEDFELDADYIRIDEKNHLIFARGRIDPKRRYGEGRPISKSKDEKPVESDSLLFNYDTKKGKIWNPATEQDGNFISGGQAKVLPYDEVAYRNVIFSTCSLPFPDTHFGIVITKGIGQKKRIISGPAYLEVEGVPLPFAIPFGFFPKPNTRSSGVILPTFGEDQKLGFYLRNLGYYVGINDNIDVTFMGSLYSKGSYELSANSRYLKRYKYGGNVTLSYGSHNYGLVGDPPRKDFNITWSHSQDPNANPGTTFSASVNAGTSSFYQNSPGQKNYNLQSLTQNNLRSSINYGRTWAGTPFNLNVSLGHSQDLTKKTVTLELPTFSFNMSTISPFDPADRVGEQKWYQKINVGYSLVGTNKLNSIPESELFTKNTLTKKLQNGMMHTVPISLNLNVLKYFQFNTGGTYTERWNFQTIRKRFDRGSISGQLLPITDTVAGFARSGEYNLNAGVSTKVYSTIYFKKGSLTAIRTTTTPQISFSYRPDFGDPSYGYYRTAVSAASVPYPYTSQQYSIFEQSAYPGPSAGKQAGIGFSLDNTIEAKLKPKSTDTSGVPRKIPILQGLSLSTFYNFAADSLKLSNISLSGHTSILNQKVNINFSGNFDPYLTLIRDSISNGEVRNYVRRVNRLSFSEGKFPLLQNFSLSMSASLNPATFHPKPQQNVNGTLAAMTPDQSQRLALINSDPGAYIDFNVPWNLSINYSFSYQNNIISSSSSNTVMLSGDVSITRNWKIQYNTNYDLKARQLSSATSFAIYRDLHCWDLSIQWLPFGFYKSYNVTLKVKASILQDLKLSKRNDYTNNQSFN